MSEAPAQDRKAFTDMVQESLKRAERHTAALRNANAMVLIASTATSAATTLVAGGTAVHGPIIGQEEAGWRLACIVAAALAFVATISNGLNQQFKFNERLLQGNQCVGRLRALHLQLATGGYEWGEATKEYAEIAKAYPEHISG